MKIYNATKRTIGIAIGNKNGGDDTPEMVAKVLINESVDLPIENFKFMTIVNGKGKRGRKEIKYVIGKQ